MLPPAQGGSAAPPRLIRRLDEGLRLEHRLTLVSAPAGYGNTTLLSQRVDERVSQSGGGLSIAWLSLDAEDSDPVRFWTYLVAALQQVEADLGQGLREWGAVRKPLTSSVGCRSWPGGRS